VQGTRIELNRKEVFGYAVEWRNQEDLRPWIRSVMAVYLLRELRLVDCGMKMDRRRCTGTRRAWVAVMTASSSIGGGSARSSRCVQGRQHSDPDYRADTAMGAPADLVDGDGVEKLTAIGGRRQKIGKGNDQELTTERQFGGAMAVGRKAKVEDALKTGRQHVHKKAPDELIGTNLHDFRVLLVFVFVILPLKRDLSVLI
jgi:hypothetical protein